MITTELAERVREAKEVGDNLSVRLSGPELQLLHRLGILADAAVSATHVYRPGPNFLVFCSVVFADRLDEFNDRMAEIGGGYGVDDVNEILTDIDHIPDDEID